MIYMILCAMSVIIFLLFAKLYLIKKSAREITSDLSKIIKDDTNTGLRISSRDKDMCELADSINVQLKELRKEHLQYYQGNTELKNAITNISHDIRTPLTAIYGYLDMIQKTDDPEKQAKYISIVKDRAELMKQLTEELFRYSIILSQDDAGETEEVFVNQVLAESISGYYAVLTKRNIIPEIHITQNKIIRNLNKTALSRIFSNLLNNAVKYSDGDLEITLSDTGEIIFANTAKGLSSIQVERLFDRFYTVETARSSTGLGLSIARMLVERMGGTISAEYRNNILSIKLMFNL